VKDDVWTHLYSFVRNAGNFDTSPFSSTLSPFLVIAALAFSSASSTALRGEGGDIDSTRAETGRRDGPASALGKAMAGRRDVIVANQAVMRPGIDERQRRDGRPGSMCVSDVEEPLYEEVEAMYDGVGVGGWKRKDWTRSVKLEMTWAAKGRRRRKN
jgi:hypothetical protein